MKIVDKWSVNERKGIGVLTSVVVLLAILLVALLRPSSPLALLPPAQPVIQTPQTMGYTMLDGEEKLPILRGATGVKDAPNVYMTLYRTVVYTVETPADAVVQFYDNALPSLGWTRLPEEYHNPTTVYEAFNTEADTPNVPYSEKVEITISSELSPQTVTTLEITRIPNLQYLPLYPAGNNVPDKDIPTATTIPAGYRAVQFMTSDSPDSVYAYYKKILRQYGWFMFSQATDGTTEAQFAIGGPEHASFGTMIVSAERQNAGETLVTVSVGR